jgi:uncharacterized Ntn-hydrolase superfamily protein
MSEPRNPSRRAILQRVAAGLSVAYAADPLLNEQDSEAKQVHYVEDASRAREAQSGSNCSNCSIYTAMGDTSGSCGIFKGKLVKAAGWCNQWSGL